MGCGMSKHQRPSEANYVGTELIRMAPPTRRPGFRPEGSPTRGRSISLPINVIAGNPPMYEHINAGLHETPRPMTSSGIPSIPRIDITHDVIVEQDEAVPANAGGTTNQADDAANKATTTTTVEGGEKVAAGTVKDSN